MEKSQEQGENALYMEATGEGQLSSQMSSVEHQGSSAIAQQSLGGGQLPTSRKSQRQWDIANVLPVSEVKLMTRRHWNELFALEFRDLPRDYRKSDKEGQSAVAILGKVQPHVTRLHRYRIVNWMSEACALFRWTSQTFFAAVHAWDAYMTRVSHAVLPQALPKLSAACLYFGAELLESAADDGVKTLAEFTEMCPELGSVEGLRETQAHLVDTLQGMSLARRTPTDFLLLFLAQLQLVPAPGPQLFEALLSNNLLDVVWDLALNVSLVVYSNGLILDGLPGSRWVAGVLLRMLEFVAPRLRTRHTPEREFLLKTVFHCTEADEQQAASAVDQILQRVWHHVAAPDAVSRAPPSTPGPSHTVVRHRIPPDFLQWLVVQPQSRTVQRISASLRISGLLTSTADTALGVGPFPLPKKQEDSDSRETTSPVGVPHTAKV